jgi:hypothetical protein
MNRLWKKIKELIDLGFVLFILIPMIWVFLKLTGDKEGFWWKNEENKN